MARIIALVLLLIAIFPSASHRTQAIHACSHARAAFPWVLKLRGGSSEEPESSSSVEDASEEPESSSKHAKAPRSFKDENSRHVRSASPASPSSTAQTSIYCKLCGVPEEYCSYIERCARNKKIPKKGDLAPDLSGQKDNLSAVAPKSGTAETRDAASDEGDTSKTSLTTHSSSSVNLASLQDAGIKDHVEAGIKDQEPAGVDNKIKQKIKQKSKKDSCVKIKVDKRRARKFVTTVTGMENFMAAGETLKDAAKMLAQTLAAGASAVKGTPGQPDHIVIQGDFSEKIKDLCVEKLKVSPGLVKIETAV
jgi:translation initiation factor 1 (eIF-1/SUI1)